MTWGWGYLKYGSLPGDVLAPRDVRGWVSRFFAVIAR